MPHNFNKWPELTNSQMDFYYFASPHRQITEDFSCTVTKVIDGDTIRVRWSGRNFEFPIRMLNTNAPEMSEKGGKRSKSWLESQILGEKIEVIMDQRQRVGKWGRLLGTIMSRGLDINELSIILDMATPFDQRNEGKIPDFHQEEIGAQK